MRSFLRAPLAVLAMTASLLSPAAAEKMLLSNSLNLCQQDSSLQASLFNVVYTPANNSASINMVATSSVQGKVQFDIEASAYGYTFLRQTLDPCDIGLAGLCPMVSGKLAFGFNLPVSASASDRIPGIAYQIPDLDATVKVRVNLTGTGESVACVEADISNGKTVNLIGVKWATAVIAGLALVSSAIINGLGHSNTAAHVAANSLSLFGYFQAQAIVGLCGIRLPPIVQAWTQDFQWSMGIIRVGFMQTIFTWYQRATGGTPSTIFDSLTTVSVQIEKRGLSVSRAGMNLFKRAVAIMPKPAVELVKRANITTGSGSYIVFGIQRVAFKAGIETTNLFLTGLVFFWLFALFTAGSVVIFKGLLELLAKRGVMKNDRFIEFRNGWITVLKGILFRVCLIGFPQMAILCLWEFTQRDSAAEVVLAVFFFFGPLITLAWGASKVIRIARRSISMHRNPAYILFSDPQALNKWGFLYVQFRASAYYFIIPLLFYTLIKSMFIALAQRSGVTQAISLIIIEAGFLIGASVLRPWMDKSTNSFNIAIGVINFLNAIFLFIFTNVFDAPLLVVGVVGVVLFILNAAFSLILILMVIIMTIISLVRKNPDARYQFMSDDRASFMKSQTQLNATTELDALAATARGDKLGYKAGFDLDDNESMTSAEIRKNNETSASYSVSATNSQNSFYPNAQPPPNAAIPLYPAQRGPSSLREGVVNPHASGVSLAQQRTNTASPASGHRSQHNASPWQRGAGYDH
ncbi:calcium- spray [Trichoderma arundinaceum]|uniref:Calcium-spray n=1 Tax=Trichoderma arundinaceum TaxID=490622 RepID=A0A395NPU2_TRIAR|nr:calcium- spray [Trichoderma arundinaceum]